MLPSTVLLWQMEMFSSQLWVIAALPKTNVSWTALSQELPSTQPNIHPRFLRGYKLQLVAGTINTIQNLFLQDLFKL